MHVYEVRPRKDKRGVDLISDVLPFGRLWYDTTGNAVPSVVVCEVPTSSKTEIGQLTQFAMINCRLPVRTSLAEQEQHYSSPAVSP